MQGVGPGTVLGGRYSLRRRLSQERDLERWSGHDATLEREVTLTIVGSEHRNCAGVLDAARRAAGVEDTRLVRILDVGAQNDTSFIVEESMSGSDSLATILLQGPLPAEEARRVAGETAKALETAGQRGLHHLRLTPHHVLIASDGTIRVSGVAVAAAIDGPDQQEPDSATALRRDAISLAAITYTALTSRWPLDEKIPGVEPAPRMINGVVAPAEIAAGVPGDLDALCQLMLNEHAGPLTPGVFANRIAPWSRQPVHRDEHEPTAVLPLPGSDVGGDTPTGDLQAGDASVSTVGTEPTVVFSAHAVPPQATPGGSTGPVPPSDQAPPIATPNVGEKASAAGAATTKAFGTAFSSAGAAAGAVGSKLGSFARAASERKSAGPDSDQTGSNQTGSNQTGSGHEADNASDQGNQGGEGAGRGNEQVGLPDGLTGHFDDVEAPLPMLPASTALPPSRGQSKTVVLVVAVFVGLALFVGYRGLLGPVSDSAPGKPTPRRTVTVSAPAVTVSASTAPTAAPTAAGPIAILSATGFDPEGDKIERNGQVARVYDGDLTTAWTSEGYGTADFGNLKKGVGVILDLGQPTSVHQVTIDLGSGPVDVTAYAATEPRLEGATVVGTATDANGRVQLKATKTMPKAQYVIVWFTKIAPDGNQFRASISEIALN
ncbi:MAG TPA: protein kinase family protein [Dermatophilaceae bacterium]